MNIEITSASRKEQRAADVAAAVFVITHDDIRRSGMTTIPDLLRLAPGVDVAQINSNKWAVSVRGFNALVREQAARPRRRPQRLQPDLLGRALGHRGPDARRHRSNRGDSRSRRSDVGRQRRERRDQHRHQIHGRDAGWTRPRRSRALWRAGRRPLRRDPRRDALPTVHAVDRPRSIAHRPRTRAPTMRPTASRRDSAPTGPTRPGAFSLEGSFTAGQARALWPNFDPQTAAREPIANDSHRHAGRPPHGPLDAHPRRAARRSRSSRSSTWRAGWNPWGTTNDRPSASTRSTTRLSAGTTISSPEPAIDSSTSGLTATSAFP